MMSPDELELIKDFKRAISVLHNLEPGLTSSPAEVLEALGTVYELFFACNEKKYIENKRQEEQFFLARTGRPNHGG